MGRKSKYAAASNLPEKISVALYIRLSREDGDSEESDSIINQKTLLKTFIEDNPEFTSVYDVYIDDGYTGTNFDRPAFQKMIKDMENKLVNCVICKDLSRFGRDYIGVGNYLEKIFPKYNVRFISINENFDSADEHNRGNNIIIPIQSVINDKYAADISIKVRSAFDAKRRNGEFIGAFAPYGYKKDEQDKNKLVIDESVSWVIKKIYSMLIEGYSKIEIARKLNNENIPCPTEYKKQQGLNYHNSNKIEATKYWTYSTVHKILTNEVYIGNLIQKKSQVVSYKVKKKIKVEESKQIKKECTHKPIIDIDTWNKVQDILSRDTKAMKTNKVINLFAGYLRCGDCGRALHRNTSKYTKSDGTKVNWHSYICGSYAVYRNCTRHTFKEDDIYNIVLNDIRKNAKLALVTDEVVEILNAKQDNRVKRKRLNIELDKLEKEYQRVYQLKKSVYEDWKAGYISREDYIAYKEDYENQQKQLEQKIETLREERNKEQEKIDNHNVWLMKFKKYAEIEELDRDIIVDLVDCILVYENGKDKMVEIKYKYEDEFIKLIQELPDSENIPCINDCTVGSQLY